MFFDIVTPVGAAADARVPPDTKALSLKRVDERS
jgi:hypothetical protein